MRQTTELTWPCGMVARFTTTRWGSTIHQMNLPDKCPQHGSACGKAPVATKPHNKMPRNPGMGSPFGGRRAHDPECGPICVRDCPHFGIKEPKA
jgi:hypothetical protein